MLKPDRFSCSQKIRLKWDPPVNRYITVMTLGHLIFQLYSVQMHIALFPCLVILELLGIFN